jgi:hypothetical protein
LAYDLAYRLADDGSYLDIRLDYALESHLVPVSLSATIQNILNREEDRGAMAYGRLDIHWPDGQLETFMLASDTVSVGRAEGNTISLDTDTISRYHFSLTREADGTVSIMDLESANGTFVDGSRLRDNEAYPLGATEEIQVGALRVIFRQVDNSPTLAMTPTDDDTARIERESADFVLNFDRVHLDAWPAASASSELSITNQADEVRRFSVRVSGMPGEWLRVNRPVLEIQPNDTGYVLIYV